MNNIDDSDDASISSSSSFSSESEDYRRITAEEVEAVQRLFRMGSDDDSDDVSSSSAFSSESEEEKLRDVIRFPQNEDNEIDKRVFRNANWDRNAYDYVIGPIKKCGYTEIPHCASHFHPKSQHRAHVDIDSGKIDELELDDNVNMLGEYKAIAENAAIRARIGKYCFDNKRIKYFHVQLASWERECLTGFFRHWKGRQSELVGLDLVAPDMGDEGRLGGVRMGEIFRRFLHNNTELEELHVCAQMGLNNVRDLVMTLSNKTLSLVHVGFTGNLNLGNEGVELLSTALCNIPTIETVNFNNNGINRYSSIASLLQNSSLCCLEQIDIGGNNIGDLFIADLVASLVGNSQLKSINISMNEQITDVEWGSILMFIRNTSNFNALAPSNHSLVLLGRPNTEQRSYYPIPTKDDKICTDLNKALSTNEIYLSPMDKAQKKVIALYFHDTESQLSKELLAMDVQLVPFILAIVGT